MRTTVKAWYGDKGFGFLKNGGYGSKDILVHVSELRNCEFLKPGRTVEFDCDYNEKGLVAKNVHLVHDLVSKNERSKKYEQPKPTFNDHWYDRR